MTLAHDRIHPASFSLASLLAVLALGFVSCASPTTGPSGEVARWEERARNVTITRDNWGIPHIHGKTDADAVFGMIYAQCEDDFPRVEYNYHRALGRLALVKGKSALFDDLRIKMFNDPENLKTLHRQSPAWLQALMNAWADGLNYYLHTHPEVRPQVIERYEPWMALSFTEGSISQNTNRISPQALGDFYGDRGVAWAPPEDPRFMEPVGSNGIAVAPTNTDNGHALLLINPHTSFYFRTEQHVSSDEGLNVYGAVTWGQFFVYQGFNERLGWAHTTSRTDTVDEFLETIVERNGRRHYVYGNEERPLTTSTITVPYRTDAGGRAEETFTVYRTHRGPIVRKQDGKWVSVGLMYRPVDALSQSYRRTKARTFDSFLKVLETRANSSNNTIYADADGNIAYLTPGFVPRRDDRFDFTEPVDGSNPATDWGELHPREDTPSFWNPPNGWIQNTNNAPYSAAGAHSPKQEKFPRYMARAGENYRGLNAIRVLSSRRDFTLQTFMEAAYDSYVTSLAQAVPPLIVAYDRLPGSDPKKARLAEPIALLRTWDFRWSVDSIPTTLALLWTEQVESRDDQELEPGTDRFTILMERTPPERMLQTLADVMERLEKDFGTWRLPWGRINRFQRLTGAIDQRYNDEAPSIPVGMVSGRWGSMASFGAGPRGGSKKRYGSGGNSFVAVVEFGERLRARAVTAGGQSGDPASAHFTDQAERYATGNLREVYFHPSDLARHTERKYHPGQ